MVAVTFSLTLYIARQRDSGRVGAVAVNHRQNKSFSTMIRRKSREPVENDSRNTTLSVADRTERKFRSSCPTVLEMREVSPSALNHGRDAATTAGSRYGRRRSFFSPATGVERRRRTLKGSRRTLLILSCLFLTQVMSTLPVFLLFLLVHYNNNNTLLIPSIQSTTLLTTLLVSNTGLNPVIRIVIKPEYNNSILAALSRVCSVCSDC